MKKLLLSLLLLVGAVSVHAKKVYPTGFGNVAGNAQWDTEASVLSWFGSWSNSVDIQGLSGDLSQCSLNFTAEFDNDWDTSLKQGYRILVYANGDYQNAVAIKAIEENAEKGANAFGTFSFTMQELGVKANDAKNICRICFAGLNGQGKVKITNVFLYKPLPLEFNDEGKAYIYPEEFLTTGDVTVNEETGVVTVNGKGSIKVNFAKPVDFTYVTQYVAEGASRNLGETCQFYYSDNTVVNTWYNSAYKITNWGDYSTKPLINEVIGFQIFYPGDTGTVTINKVTIIASGTISAISGKEDVVTDLTDDLFHHWTAGDASATQTNSQPFINHDPWGTSTGCAYGNTNVGYLDFANLSMYDQLVLTVASGEPRLLFNRTEDNGTVYGEITSGNNNKAKYVTETTNEDNTTNYVVDLTSLVADLGFAHLHSIKSVGWGTSVTITEAKLIKKSGEFDYILNGVGVFLPSATAALADEYASLYDATAVTGAVKLVAANPNAVIIANRADVTGTNVVVDGTCADFAIVDNKPYKYNGAFSAASAKQTVTVSAAGFSTTVVPFNAAVPEGLKAYNVEAINADNTIAVEEVTSVEAGKPVLLEGEGTFTFEASGASVAASAGALSNGILTASYAGLDVTGGGYVLQNQEEGVAFYKFEGARSMKPFRAYIPATGASGAKTLNIGIGESTGIMALNHADATTAVRYNAAGQKLNGMQKGLNIVKMSNGEVKKVFVK